jgi:small subunit ribosomal protein S16
MATRIRLRREGRKKLPMYRIVVGGRAAPRAGRGIEVVGTDKPKAAEGRPGGGGGDKARAWIAKGATATETVQSLLKRAGVFQPVAAS